MATRQYLGLAGAIAQVDTFTVAGTPAAGNTISVTINLKKVLYTLITGDTVTSAGIALQGLLAASTYPEFQEITWASGAAGIITATCSTAGLPFTATCAATGGGATITHSGNPTTAPVSPNDVSNANNWSGATLPVNGDSVVLADSDVSLLYGLTSLSGVTLANLTVWMDFTGQIGLPENNPNGYFEYRPTFWQIGATTIIIGSGSFGNGSGLMRIDVGAVTTTCNVLQTGAIAQGTDYALRLMGTDAGNILKVSGGTVGIGMTPYEAGVGQSFTTVIVQQTGSLDLGPQVTATTVTCNGATLNMRCGGTTLTVNGGTVLITGATYTTLNSTAGATITWIGPGTTATGTITTLSLLSGSTLDASQDPRAKTVTNSTISGDSVVNDPNNTITWTNATTISGAISSGVFVIGPGKTIKVS